MDRSYIFMSEIGVALAMDATPALGGLQDLKFAITFCNKKDNFTRKRARVILDGRLENNSDRFIRTISFEGDKPRKEALLPMANVLRETVHEEVVLRMHPHGEDEGDVISGMLHDNEDGDAVIRRGRNVVTVKFGDIESITTIGCRRNVNKMLTAFLEADFKQVEDSLTVV